jgi:hypothetical protein
MSAIRNKIFRNKLKPLHFTLQQNIHQFIISFHYYCLNIFLVQQSGNQKSDQGERLYRRSVIASVLAAVASRHRVVGDVNEAGAVKDAFVRDRGAVPDDFFDVVVLRFDLQTRPVNVLVVGTILEEFRRSEPRSIVGAVVGPKVEAASSVAAVQPKAVAATRVLIGVALVAFNNYVKHQVSFHFNLIRKTFNYHFCFYVVSTLNSFLVF